METNISNRVKKTLNDGRRIVLVQHTVSLCNSPTDRFSMNLFCISFSFEKMLSKQAYYNGLSSVCEGPRRCTILAYLKLVLSHVALVCATI